MSAERQKELMTRRWRLLMRFGNGRFTDIQIREQLILIDWEFVEAGLPVPA